uniref:C-type lectin domain-containing protein n=1 Tax=Steinernema glaseri TaxID=37863 RepID=A0A1I7ZDR6_9BILA
NYILGITPLYFLQSKSICEQFNSHLISLHESGVAEQIEYVFSQVSSGVSDFWIGLHKDAGTNSQYTWIDGSPMDYKNWSPGYPGSSAAEKCGAYSNGKWIALSCTKLLPFVCETPPSL